MLLPYVLRHLFYKPWRGDEDLVMALIEPSLQQDRSRFLIVVIKDSVVSRMQVIVEKLTNIVDTMRESQSWPDGSELIASRKTSLRERAYESYIEGKNSTAQRKQDGRL